MADDIPTPAKGVYIFLDYVALGFVLVGVEEIFRPGESWKIPTLCFALGAVFLFFGVMGQRIKTALMKRWPRRKLAAALAENSDLRRKLEALRDEQRTNIERLSSDYDARFQQAGGQILTLQRELEALRHSKPNFGKLVIHSALWVVKGDEQHFIKAEESLRSHIREALMDTIDIPVENQFLGGDPKIRTHKVLKLAYSYGGGIQRKIEKHEGGHLTLPEPLEAETDRAVETHLMLSERDRQESLFLKTKVSDLEHQIVELKRLPAPRLTIQSAHYGRPPDQFEDVTMSLQARVRNNKLDIVVSEELFELHPFASPALIARISSPGTMFLRVVYSLGESRDLVVVRPEGAKLELPEND